MLHNYEQNMNKIKSKIMKRKLAIDILKMKTLFRNKFQLVSKINKKKKINIQQTYAEKIYFSYFLDYLLSNV